MKSRERVWATLQHQEPDRVPRFEIWIDALSDLQAVRSEVNRCLEQGAPGGGYMIATCNSIFEGMNSTAVAEMFRFQAELGF